MTETNRNLLTAHVLACGEHVRLQYAAKTARKEGYVQISELCLEVAARKKVHAKRFLKLAEPEDFTPSVNMPAPVLGDTAANLRSLAAVAGRMLLEVYPAFAHTARDEGLAKAAGQFASLTKAEEQHQRMFLELAELVEAGTFFSRPEPVGWVCLHCGFSHQSRQAPEICPACEHPWAHFALRVALW